MHPPFSWGEIGRTMARLEARVNAALPPIKAQIDERPIMKFSRCLAFAFLVAAVFPARMNSQQVSAAQPTAVPHLVNFSGKAIDDRQKPIAGVAGITFSIYKDQYAGAALWIETQSVATDKAGNFTAQLGATKTGGMPLELFTSGEARWLGVRVNGEQEQSRILLLSVPYALKAADAETVGGLPASAFVLASPERTQPSVVETVSTPGSIPRPASTVTTSGGTANALPLWTTATNVQSSAITQTGSGATAKIGINTTAPTTALDVHGGSVIRGTFVLPATGAATPSAGKVSQPEDFVASSFSSATSTPVNQTFQWQATPSNNNTANPGATLNLLYGQGVAAPAQTGLRLGPKGIIGFAPGQTFPGAGNGTVTSIGVSAPASDFTITSSPITTKGTIALNWNVAPTSAATANAIVKRDADGSFSAGAIGASLGVTSFSPGIAVYGETSGGWGGADGVHGVAHGTGSGVTGVSDNANGVGVWGQSPGWSLYSAGNTGQDRTAGGWVKAMVFINGGTSSIAWCFNSTLAGTAATTPPCGFGFDKTGIGDYIVDFGFQVDDRFFSLTNVSPLVSISTCTDMVFTCNNITTANQVEISSYYIPDIKFSDAKFYLVVY